jgi:hypothetical protein
LHDLAVIDKKIRVCAVVRLLKGEKLREEMGQKARETVREKFLLTPLRRTVPRFFWRFR